MRIVEASDCRGAAHARNVGASAAEAKSLAFCDADDEVAVGWVAAMGESLAQHNWVAGRTDCQALNKGWVWETRKPMPGAKKDDFGPCRVVPSCNMGITRALHE